MSSSFEKFFHKSQLKNYLSSSLEVGYTQFGPTLGISGTVTAGNNVVFVNNISLLVNRLYDGATFQFNWLAFRPHRFQTTHENSVELKMPSKFLVSAANPYPYNVLFSDQNQYAGINPSIKLLKVQWENLVEKFSQDTEPSMTLQLFEKFLQREDVAAFHSQFMQACYWEEGNYSLTVVFVTKDTRSILEETRLFSLSESDARSLRRNAGMIIADICRQPDIAYATARPLLRE